MHNNQFSLDTEYCENIGRQAAIIDFNGQSKAYVKEYVEKNVHPGFIAYARKGYAETRAKLNSLKPVGGLFATLNFEGEIGFTSNPYKSAEVNVSYRWIIPHLNEALTDVLFI